MSVSRRSIVAALMLVSGCGDKMTCVLPPCPQFEAVTISVASSTGASTLPGLAVIIGGAYTGGAPCDSIGRACHVFGGAGTYELTVSATGYAPVSTSVTVTGASAGCGTCGKVDRQQLAITLQPK